MEVACSDGSDGHNLQVPDLVDCVAEGQMTQRTNSSAIRTELSGKLTICS